ncbi:hypothetical protein SY88_17675 [Clostridiales bacterium PH28_bin88]|nr:hypothetical protein SY88_17675 [Clostridiales bacterium PH28_bin88]
MPTRKGSKELPVGTGNWRKYLVEWLLGTRSKPSPFAGNTWGAAPMRGADLRTMDARIFGDEPMGIA